MKRKPSSQDRQADGHWRAPAYLATLFCRFLLFAAFLGARPPCAFCCFATPSRIGARTPTIMSGRCRRAAARRRLRSRAICAAGSICRRRSCVRRPERTRETLDLLLAAWRKKPTVRYESALYLSDWPVSAGQSEEGAGAHVTAASRGPQSRDRATGRRARRSAHRCSRARPPSEGDREIPHRGTCRVSISKSTSWRNLKPGSGQLVDYVRPKDLPRRKRERGRMSAT